MKILYSHRTRSADGQNVHIRALTSALRARGHEISIIGPAGIGPAGGDAAAGPGKMAAKTSALRQWTPKALYEYAECGYSFIARHGLRRAARRIQPDVIYERYNLFYDAGVWLKVKTGLPLILEVNAPLAEERADYGGLHLRKLAERSERDIWQAADHLLPVSHVLAEKLCAAGVDRDKITVIPNGVDDAFLAPRDGAVMRGKFGLEGKTVLGFSGFIRDWHRLDRALRFMAEIARPDLHLLLVGDGPARPALEALAASLGVRSAVTFAGVVQREEMPDALAAFDIALLPAAVAYASPLKLFEYMALGKPIIAPDQENIREILNDDKTAVLFSPTAPDAFHNALGALIDEPQRAARLGACARDQLISKDYTWAGAARKVEAIAAALSERKS